MWALTSVILRVSVAKAEIALTAGNCRAALGLDGRMRPSLREQLRQRLVIWYISLFKPTIGRDQSARGNPENTCRYARSFADQVCCRTNSGRPGARNADRHVLRSGGRSVQPARGRASL